MNKEEILKYTIDFHNTYEQLSKEFNYITRRETRQFNINSSNGKLMYATVEKVVGSLIQENINLKQALNEIREYIHSEEFFMLMNSGSIIDPPKDKPIGEDYFKAQGKLDKIIDKYLGGSDD